MGEGGVFNTEASCLPCGHPRLNQICNAGTPYACDKTDVFSIVSGSYQIAFVPLKTDISKAQAGLYGSRYALAAVPIGQYPKVASVAYSLFYFTQPRSTGSELRCMGIEYESGGTMAGLVRNIKTVKNGFALEYVRSGTSLDKSEPPSNTYPDMSQIRFSTVPSDGANACCREGYKVSMTIEARGGAWGLAIDKEDDKILVGGGSVSMTLDRVIFTNKIPPSPLSITVHKGKKDTFVTRLQKPAPIASELAWGGVSIPDKDSTNNDVLPSLYTVSRNCLPIHQGSSVKPYMLAYLNSDDPVRNYNFEPIQLSRKDAWVKIYEFLSLVTDGIELSRKAGAISPWYQRLRDYGLHTKPFESFYYSFVGNSKELWILLYIAGDSPSKSVGGLGPVKPLAIEENPSQFTYTIMQPEQFLFRFDKNTGGADDSCWLPVYRDCGTSFGKRGFCTGRASAYNGTRCSAALTKLDMQTKGEKDSLIQKYCNLNPTSTDCACHRRYDDPMFSYLIKHHGHQVVTMDSCWWKPCLSRDKSMLLTNNDDVVCDETKACFNFTWIGDSSNLDLSSFTQIATCGTLGDEEEDWEQDTMVTTLSFVSYLPSVFLIFLIVLVVALISFVRYQNQKIKYNTLIKAKV